MKIQTLTPTKHRLFWELGPDPITGRRRQRTETVHGTLTTARQRWRAVQADLDRGLRHDPGRLTGGDLLDRCAADVWPLTLKPSSRLDYARKVACYLRPAFGTVPLRQLSPALLQRVYRGWLEGGRRDGRGLAPKTVQLIHAIWRAALQQAVDWEWLAKNPAHRVKLPPVVPRSDPAWTRATWHRVWAQVQDEPWGVAAWLAVATGLREGEILGLQWADVEWDTGSITVRRTLVDLGHAQGGLQFQPPKTRHSPRTVAVGPATLTVLRHHRAMQGRAKLAAGRLYTDHGLIIQTERGTPYWPRNLIEHWRQAQAAVGVPYRRFHGLRHLSATWLLEHGEHPRLVADRLGHARVSTTLHTYAHVSRDADRAAALKLEQFLRDAGRDIPEDHQP